MHLFSPTFLAMSQPRRSHWALLLFSLIPLAAGAQSNLPPCEGPSSSWTDCVGTRTVSGKGSKYEGEFKGGRPEGQGTFTNPDGNTIKGALRSGRPHGQITFGSPNGTIRVIEFKDGRHLGYGTMTFTTGEKYVGGLDGFKPNGQGTYSYADGRKYTGEYKDGQFNGKGTFTDRNGNIYVGEWKDHKPHGEGIEYFASGAVSRQGLWGAGDWLEFRPFDNSRFPFSRP